MKKEGIGNGAPRAWMGGKSRVAHVVWERFGDTANYVEPFFGSGAVLLGRPHEARIETINDKDAYVHRERIWFSPHCLRPRTLFDEGRHE